MNIYNDLLKDDIEDIISLEAANMADKPSFLKKIRNILIAIKNWIMRKVREFILKVKEFKAKHTPRRRQKHHEYIQEQERVIEELRQELERAKKMYKEEIDKSSTKAKAVEETLQSTIQKLNRQHATDFKTIKSQQEEITELKKTLDRISNLKGTEAFSRPVYNEEVMANASALEKELNEARDIINENAAEIDAISDIKAQTKKIMEMLEKYFDDLTFLIHEILEQSTNSRYSSDGSRTIVTCALTEVRNFRIIRLSYAIKGLKEKVSSKSKDMVHKVYTSGYINSIVNMIQKSRSFKNDDTIKTMDQYTELLRSYEKKINEIEERILEHGNETDGEFDFYTTSYLTTDLHAVALEIGFAIELATDVLSYVP